MSWSSLNRTVRKSQRVKSVPKKVCDADHSFDGLKQKLASVGLQIKVSSEVKSLEPEVGVIVGFQTKHLVDGEVKLNVSNARFRIKQGSYQLWCTAAESLFGSPKSTGKFQHGGVTVTIYENGTVMIQGVRSVDWLVANYRHWLECTSSAAPSQADLMCDSISLSVTPSTPVSVSSSKLTPRNLSMKQLTPSAPPASQDTSSCVKPAFVSKPLTPSAPPFVPKQLTPSAPPASQSTTEERESTVFYSPDSGASLLSMGTHKDVPMTSTPIVRLPVPFESEYVAELRSEIQCKDNEISELKLELERKDDEIADLKQQVSHQKSAVKDLIKLKDGLVLKLEARNTEQPTAEDPLFEPPSSEEPPSTEVPPSPEVPTNQSVHLQSAPTIPIPKVKLVVNPSDVSLAAAHDINFTMPDSSNGSPVTQPSSADPEQDEQLSYIHYYSAEATRIDDLLAPNQSSINSSTVNHTNSQNASSQQKSTSTEQRNNKNAVWFKFGNKHGVLSNLYHCDVKVFGRPFRGREYAYQWKKAIENGRPDLAEQILKAPNARVAMHIGQGIQTSQKWKTQTKFEVMREVQIAAAQQCEPIRKKLVSTGKRPLREKTENHTWGALKPENGNKLGELLEEVRDMIVSGNLQFIEPPTKDANTQANIQSEHSKSQFTENTSTKKTSPKDNKHTNLMFGDSMSNNVKPELSSGLPFRNVSISGGRLCPRPNSSDNHTNVEQTLKSKMNGNEEHIVLQYGTNDSLGCNLNLFRKSYTSLVHTAQSSGAQVHCSGIFHRGDGQSETENYKRNAHIDRLNSVIKSVAAKNGCTFLDNCTAISSTAQNPNLDVLSKPKKGVKNLHLHQTAKLDFAFRIVDHIESGGVPPPPTPTTRQPRTQSARQNPPRPKHGRRIHKPSYKPKGGHPRSDSFDDAPTSRSRNNQNYSSRAYNNDGYYSDGYYDDGYNQDVYYDDCYYGYDDGYHGYDAGYYGDYYNNEYPRYRYNRNQW